MSISVARPLPPRRDRSRDGCLGSSLMAQDARPVRDFRSGRPSISWGDATVTTERPLFVPRLRRRRLTILEDGERRRSPVETDASGQPGIVLDPPSGASPAENGGRTQAPSPFVFELLGSSDERSCTASTVRPILVQDRPRSRALARALDAVIARGGTRRSTMRSPRRFRSRRTNTTQEGAGRNSISSNDTNSDHHRRRIQQLIHESKVMVSTIRIEGAGDTGTTVARTTDVAGPGRVVPIQVAVAGPAPSAYRPDAGWWHERTRQRAGASMLTETAADGPRSSKGAPQPQSATAGIASELGRQYFLGYVSTRPKRWMLTQRSCSQGRQLSRSTLDGGSSRR